MAYLLGVYLTLVFNTHPSFGFTRNATVARKLMYFDLH